MPSLPCSTKREKSTALPFLGEAVMGSHLQALLWVSFWRPQKTGAAMNQRRAEGAAVPAELSLTTGLGALRQLFLGCPHVLVPTPSKPHKLAGL